MDSDRLDSWKAIAAYLGYSQRTVMRWRGERNLPVHQFPGKSRSAVFAYRSELDQWRRGMASGLPGAAPGQPLRLSAQERAWHLWDARSEENLEEILECFRHAVREDWNGAAAYAGLACALLASSICNRIQGSIALLQARAAAERAMQLAPELAISRCADAWLRFWQERDFSGAARCFEQILQDAPNCSFAATGRAWVGAAMGEQENSAGLVEQLLLQGSFSPYSTTVASRICFLGGDFRRVLHVAAQARASRSAGRMVRSMEALSRLLTGDHEAAIEALELDAYESPEDPMIAGNLGFAYAHAGETAGARAVYRVLLALADQQASGCSYPLAITAAALGQSGDALHWLERSLAEQAFPSLTMAVDPCLQSLRGDSGFAALVRQSQAPASGSVAAIFPHSLT
jgi:tetratricopeptide (TPR) repeat protein